MMFPLIYMVDICLIAFIGTGNFTLLGDGITVMVMETFGVMAMDTDLMIFGAHHITAQFMLDGILGITDTHFITGLEIDIMETFITATMVIIAEEV